MALSFDELKDMFKKFLDFFDDAFNLLRKIFEFASEADILLTVAACTWVILGFEVWDAYVTLKKQSNLEKLAKAGVEGEKPDTVIKWGNRFILQFALMGITSSFLFFMLQLTGVALPAMALFIPISYLCLASIFIVGAALVLYEYKNIWSKKGPNAVETLNQWREVKSKFFELAGGLLIVVGIWLALYGTFAGVHATVIALIGVGVVIGFLSKAVNTYVRNQQETILFEPVGAMIIVAGISLAIFTSFPSSLLLSIGLIGIGAGVSLVGKAINAYVRYDRIKSAETIARRKSSNAMIIEKANFMEKPFKLSAITESLGGMMVISAISLSVFAVFTGAFVVSLSLLGAGAGIVLLSKVADLYIANQQAKKMPIELTILELSGGATILTGIFLVLYVSFPGVIVTACALIGAGVIMDLASRWWRTHVQPGVAVLDTEETTDLLHKNLRTSSMDNLYGLITPSSPGGAVIPSTPDDRGTSNASFGGLLSPPIMPSTSDQRTFSQESLESERLTPRLNNRSYMDGSSVFFNSSDRTQLPVTGSELPLHGSKTETDVQKKTPGLGGNEE